MDFEVAPMHPDQMRWQIVELVIQCHETRKAYASVSFDSRVALVYATDIEITEYPSINDYHIGFASIYALKSMYAENDSAADLMAMIQTLQEILK